MWRFALALFLGVATSAAAQPLVGIGPHDGRARVDVAAFPWTAVMRLQIPGVSRCTAVLIDPRTVLTAAHCLYGRRLGHFAPAGSVHVLSGYARGRFAAHTLAASYRIAAGYDPTHPDANRATDVALVRLQQQLGTETLALATTPTLPGTEAMLGGYNADRAEVIEADSGCHVVQISMTLVFHDCAGTHGTSGAPLLVRGANGGWIVAGLEVGGFVGRSGGVAVAASVLQALLDHSEDAP